MTTETHTGDHYCHGDHECIDVIRAWMTKEAFRDYLRGTLLKYLSRYGRKDNPTIEARKILVYATWLLANETDEPLRKPS
jgi:hypothetical protein